MAVAILAATLVARSKQTKIGEEKFGQTRYRDEVLVETRFAMTNRSF